MEGEKVEVISKAEERDGEVRYETSVSKKPQFMLDEEYIGELLVCASEAVKKVCETVYPNNPNGQEKMCRVIFMRVGNEMGL